MQANLDAHVTVPPAVSFRELDGETVLLHTGSGKYFGLDEVGSRAWSLLVRRGSVREVFGALLAEYEVAADRLERDLLRLLEDLAAQELLEIHGP